MQNLRSWIFRRNKCRSLIASGQTGRNITLNVKVPITQVECRILVWRHEGSLKRETRARILDVPASPEEKGVWTGKNAFGFGFRHRGLPDDEMERAIAQMTRMSYRLGP